MVAPAAGRKFSRQDMIVSIHTARQVNIRSDEINNSSALVCARPAFCVTGCSPGVLLSQLGADIDKLRSSFLTWGLEPGKIRWTVSAMDSTPRMESLVSDMVQAGAIAGNPSGCGHYISEDNPEVVWIQIQQMIQKQIINDNNAAHGR